MAIVDKETKQLTEKLKSALQIDFVKNPERSMTLADMHYLLYGLLEAIERNADDIDPYYILLEYEDILDEKGFLLEH